MWYLVKCYKHFTHILLILITTSRNRSCFFPHFYTQGNWTTEQLPISLRAIQLVIVLTGFALGGLTKEVVVVTIPLISGHAFSLFSAQTIGFMVTSFLKESWPMVATLAPGPLYSLLCCFCIRFQHTLAVPPWKSLHDFVAGVIRCVAGAGLWGARGSELSPSREDSSIRGTGSLLETQEPLATWQR